MKRFTLLAAALLALFALPAQAVDLGIDSVSIEGGYSPNDNGDVGMTRVGVQWDWGVKWFENSYMYLGGYWDAQAGYWHSSDTDLGDFSITPVFRLQSSATSGFVPYAEFAIGAHVLTDKTITQHRVFSTNFQFGDHVGAGFRFGDKAEYDIGYRYQHLSNGSIDTPNPGINFHELRFMYHF
jgi:lipid A 3-O-deacylase